MLIPVYDIEYKKVEDIELIPNITDYAQDKNHLIEEAVISYLVNKRKGCASTLNRALVTGSNRKPYKQKGTGLARMGTLKSPLLRGGGVIFGPSPKDFHYKMPLKKKRMALNLAIAQKICTGSFYVIDGIELETPKTKEIIRLLGNFGIKDSVMFVTEKYNHNVFKSFANIPNTIAKVLREMNVFYVLKYNTLMISKSAIQKFQEMRFQ
ncbi:50S ribosomal protein L4 [bacterium]|nr:50S ribosomal protein L4 [bacterium]